MERFVLNASAEVSRWERRQVARKAAAAILYGLEPPRTTPLERDAAREAEAIHRRRQVAALRARVQT
jgi:hypothetical protein